MYKRIIRPLLFSLDPEKAHHVTNSMVQVAFKIPLVKTIVSSLYSKNHPSLEKELFGIKFKNPVGLAAGFDKDAKMIDALDAFGFGFIEIGTVTPKGQEGNEKPRLFRLVEDKAIINRMGFNNDGMEAAVKRLKKRKSKVVVGGNIGKNKVTPNEEALSDYLKSFEALFDYVDYFVVNVSSPNTPNLRALQEKEPLKNLLVSLMSANKKKACAKPILLKIAPDLTEGQITDIVEIAQETNIDGLIVSNTTIDRSNLKSTTDKVNAIGMGGLSGAPLKNKSNEVLSVIRKAMGKEFPIIGVGGIMTAQDALDKIEAGADLVQLYTGFIYEGPSLVKKINKKLLRS